MEKTFEEAAIKQVEQREQLEKSLEINEDFKKHCFTANKIILHLKDVPEELCIPLQFFNARIVRSNVLFRMGTPRNEDSLKKLHIEGSFISTQTYLPYTTILEHQEHSGFFEGYITIYTTESDNPDNIKKETFPNVFVQTTEFYQGETYRFTADLPEEEYV